MTEHARDEDDEQTHLHTTSVEEIDTVAASETTGTDVVVDVGVDAHRVGARDEDDKIHIPLHRVRRRLTRWRQARQRAPMSWLMSWRMQPAIDFINDQ